MPEISSPYTEDYEVEATLNRIGVMRASFHVRVVPASPKQWKILFAGLPHDGIMVGESDDLMSKVQGGDHILLNLSIIDCGIRCCNSNTYCFQGFA